MVDLADGIEARNYCIRRRTDRRSLTELLLTTSTLLMIAGALLFCLWARFGIMQIGYEEQQLRTVEASLVRTQTALILEEETLKHPQRIESIARDELGMFPVRLNQLLPVGVTDIEAASPTALAMAQVPSSGGGGRRSSPNN
jgi:cell division protein FtsL